MTDIPDSWDALRLLGPGAFIAAMALSAGLILVLRPWLKLYALARPNDRSSHKEPTAQGGGLAVLIAALAVAGLTISVTGAAGLSSAGALIALFVAAISLAFVGAIDDWRSLGAGTRLGAQAVAVAAVVAFLPADVHVVPLLPIWLERALLVIGGVWFVNLVNFMDGIDWMTVAEIVPVTAGLVLLGLMGALPPSAIIVAIALCGATAGFAPFNRPVASLFLGDVGSLPIGLLVGWLLMLVAASGHATAALLLPLYYLADATITLARRLHAGERVWVAHRSHFYQRAFDRGMSNYAIVGRVFAVNVALVVLALATMMWPSWQIDLVALAAGAVAVAGLLANFARGRA